MPTTLRNEPGTCKHNVSVRRQSLELLYSLRSQAALSTILQLSLWERLLIKCAVALDSLHSSQNCNSDPFPTAQIPNNLDLQLVFIRGLLTFQHPRLGCAVALAPALRKSNQVRHPLCFLCSQSLRGNDGAERSSLVRTSSWLPTAMLLLS